MSTQFSDILPDANLMQKNEILKANLRETVRELLIYISEQITKARPNGETHIYVSLPMYFNLNGIKNEDAQLYVWSTILSELELKNYKVKIEKQEKKILLYISWKSELDVLETKKQHEIIKKYS